MKAKEKYKTPPHCSNLFIYFSLPHFILLLSPCYNLPSPNEWCRRDCFQFSATNKKSFLVCTTFSEQLRAPAHSWVWVRLVGADCWVGQVPLGKQVGLIRNLNILLKPVTFGCLLIWVRQEIHINEKEKVVWGFFLHLAGTMGNTMSVPEEAEEDNTCTVKSYQVRKSCPLSYSLVTVYCNFQIPWCAQS